MIELHITKERIGGRLDLMARWDSPNDGIHPSHECTLWTGICSEDAAEAWLDGVAATIEATHQDKVKRILEK